MNSDSGCACRGAARARCRWRCRRPSRRGRAGRTRRASAGAARRSACPRRGAFGEGEVHRNRLRAGADLERDAVIAQQQAEPLPDKWAEQLRPRQRGPGAGAGEAVGEPRSRRAPRCRCVRARSRRNVRPDVRRRRRCSASRRWAMPGISRWHAPWARALRVSKGRGGEGGLVARVVIVAGFASGAPGIESAEAGFAAEDSANSTDAVDLPRKIPVRLDKLSFHCSSGGSSIAKVIVLGSGRIGTTSAWHLAQAGHEVTVIDRQDNAGAKPATPTPARCRLATRRPGRARPKLPSKRWRLLMQHRPLVDPPEPRYWR